MAISGAGFDGTLLEADWARLNGPAGVPDQSIPGQSLTDLEVSVSTSALSCTIAPTVGGYVRHGINIKSTLTETRTFTNPASGSRWDVVAALIDWTTNTVTVEVVQGTSTQAVPWASMQTTVGTKVHEPLALVKLTAGSAAPTAIIDLRTMRTRLRYRDPATGNGLGFIAPGVIFSVAEGRAMFTGAFRWSSGAMWGLGITGTPLPAPETNGTGLNMVVGTAWASSGGSAAVWITPAGNLYLDQGFSLGAWNLGCEVRIEGSYALASAGVAV